MDGDIIKKDHTLYLRNIIFGVEDSLVSTVGLLSGVAIADVPRATIILTGLVLIAVEAFSMGVGSFLSEHSVQKYTEQAEVPRREAIVGGLVMFFSYLVAGFVPLFPYVFLLSAQAFWISIALSLASLFLLGAASALLFRINIFKNGLEMAVIGGIAIALGVLVGKFAEKL
jgi:VIT1/CCC1 family predicted Fe2+/Mn2+ transporter